MNRIVTRSKKQETVTFVENLCDKIEEQITPEVVRHMESNYFGDNTHVSIPATLAALRLHYYINLPECPSDCESIEAHNIEQTDFRYKQLNYLLTDNSSNWNGLTDEDKGKLLKYTGIRGAIFVY